MEEKPRKEHRRKKKKRRETVEVKMDYVPGKEGDFRPFVSYFPTGFDPVAKSEGVAAAGEESTGLADIRVYRGSDRLKAKQHQLVMATSQGQVDFVGVNYTGEAAAWQPCSYVIGVFDKEKGSLKLVPLGGEKIFRMEPRIRGVNYDQDAKVATGDDTPQEVQTREMGLLKRRQLTETFGNQKSRSQALQAERGVVKEEALGDAEEIETLFQEAGQNDALLTTDQVLQQANMSLSRNVPPHDVTATTPEGAYPLDRLIMQEEWKALDVKEIKVAAKKSSAEEALRQSDTYPNFVLSRLQRIRVEGDKEGNKKRAHILVYLRHLLTFNNASASLIRKAAVDPLRNPGLSGHGKPVDLADELSIPGVVVARFLKQFTSETFSTDDRFGGRQRGKDHRDLLVSYVLVLGLAVDDFQTDPFDLAVELKMTLSELRPHYRELGCKFERCSAGERVLGLGDSMQNMQGKWKVTLPVPLQFPQVLTSRGRSRRGR